MSLPPQKVETIPAETVRVATAAFPKGNFCLKLRDELGTLYQDQQFVKLFSSEGQPALAPWRLALITVLQFVEGLSDRQAAEMGRSRIDWKYLLSLDLTDSGFHYSVLSEFRGRLLEGQAEYPKAIRKVIGKKVLHRTNHYLNNRIEHDQRAIKQSYYPMRGFQAFESATRLCVGFHELRNFFKSGPNLNSPVLRQLQYLARIEVYQSRIKAA